MHQYVKHQAVRTVRKSGKILTNSRTGRAGSKTGIGPENSMQISLPHSLVRYLILTLVLSALFLAFMYTTGPKHTGNPEPTAANTRTGAVLRSAPPNSYEQRFRQLEQWLGQTQDAYEARFAQLEQRLVQAAAPHDDRLLKIEQQLAQVINPQVDRLGTIEASLAQTTSRLDALSNSLAALTNDTNTIVAANKALRTEPPAALQHQPLASVPTASPQPPTSTTLAQVPGTSTTTEPPDQNPAARASKGKSKWAINLASYVSRQTAARKMESFQKQGIATEMVSAHVSGRTIYRVRVAGFDTLQAARTMAPAVERQLGLKETWIMAN